MARLLYESLPMKTSIQPEKAAEEMVAIKDKWLRENRGVLARIASDLGVSHTKVRFSYSGAIRTVDQRVAQALAEAGAPGFAK
jgi:hypothetical protein